MTEYLTDKQYFRTLFIGVGLFTGIVFGFPILQSIIGIDIMQFLVLSLTFICVGLLAYLRIDKVVCNLV